MIAKTKCNYTVVNENRSWCLVFIGNFLFCRLIFRINNTHNCKRELTYDHALECEADRKDILYLYRVKEKESTIKTTAMSD